LEVGEDDIDMGLGRPLPVKQGDIQPKIGESLSTRTIKVETTTTKLKRMHKDVDPKLNLVGLSLPTTNVEKGPVVFFKLSSATSFTELCGSEHQQDA
jgi:hypothetical protein